MRGLFGTTTKVVLSISKKMASYSLKEFGSKFSPSYKAFLYDEKLKSVISPFHDIPLFHDEKEAIINVVIEIPRWTNAKFEISTKDKLNPIKQDIKKGAPRFVDNFFPFHGYPWNYGAIPQTWEDPEFVDPHTKAKGDNDPIDVIEIGSQLSYTGQVMAVKVIGCVALIDEGETDWKVIAINLNDKRASKINSFADLNTHFPKLLDLTVSWLRHYKVSSGSAPNKFAFEGEYFKDQKFTLNIIKETHESWKNLMLKKNTSLSLLSALPSALHLATEADVQTVLKECEAKSKESDVPSTATNVCNVNIPELTFQHTNSK